MEVKESLKKIKEFFGKPIIYYSIKKAIESKCFDEVMVSTTDCNIIKDISLKYGAKVPFLRDQTIIREIILESKT